MWSNGFQIAGAGTAFPGGPALNDVFLRTDHGSIYIWNGTYWSGLNNVPIGAIVAWTNNLFGSPALPTNFQLCDGSPITDTESPFYKSPSQNTPNLNGSSGTNNDGYFLRGASTATGTPQPDNVVQHTHTFAGNTLGSHSHFTNIYTSGSGGTSIQGAATNTTQSMRNPGTTSVSAGTPSGTNSNYPSSVGTPNETYPKNIAVKWVMRIK